MTVALETFQQSTYACVNVLKGVMICLCFAACILFTDCFVNFQH